MKIAGYFLIAIGGAGMLILIATLCFQLYKAAGCAP